MEAEWVMVVITIVYVVATIFICYFNYLSVKALKRQLGESIRQYNEDKVPFIAAFPIVNYDKRICIEFKNIGKGIAKQLKIDFSDTMLNDFQELKLDFERKINKEDIIIAPGQSVFYVIEGISINKEALKTFLRGGWVYVNISYTDEQENKFSNRQIVDTSTIDYLQLNY